MYGKMERILIGNGGFFVTLRLQHYNLTHVIWAEYLGPSLCTIALTIYSTAQTTIHIWARGQEVLLPSTRSEASIVASIVWATTIFGPSLKIS